MPDPAARRGRLPLKTGLVAALLALLVLCVQGERAEATKIDTSPRPALLVGKAGLLIALKADDRLVAYSLKDGTPLHEFRAGGRVRSLEVSPDGRSLACSGSGHVAAWDLRSGRRLWHLGPGRSGLEYPSDPSFAWDGGSFVVTGYEGLVVYETTTGREIQTIRLESFLSAALSPDGSKGVVVDHEGQLHTFEVATGALKATGVRADGPARYSADGKYVACRSDNSGMDGVLRVVKLGGPPTWRDVDGLYPGIIRPAADGTFLVRVKGAPVGVRYDPATGKSEEVWNARKGEASQATLDFDAGLMLGVVTRFNLETTVYDLRTGGARLTIDNSRNYREHIISTSYVGNPLLGALSLAVVFAGVAAALAVCWMLLMAALRRW
jgi:hypothetical protein